MTMVEPVEMPLPSHPHILSRRDLGAPQTSNHDVCATRVLPRYDLGAPQTSNHNVGARRQWVNLML
jgi:hypothetical protein